SDQPHLPDQPHASGQPHRSDQPHAPDLPNLPHQPHPAHPPNGSPWQRAQALLPRLLEARYVVFVSYAAPAVEAPVRGPERAAALIALVQALNARTRAALSVLRAGGNRSGADAVATWQTGYPMAVDFGRGYPRYRPYDGTGCARITRGDVDAALVVGAVSRIP